MGLLIIKTLNLIQWVINQRQRDDTISLFRFCDFSLEIMRKPGRLN
jgi:hypothetical protein